jgi:hypothetical protein
MAIQSIYGGKEVKFGGALNMESGIGFVFLGRDQMAHASGNSAQDAINIAGLSSTNTGANSSGIQGLILQQLDIRADRPLSTFYDISSDCVYYIAGRSTVSMGLNRIVGPKGLIIEFYARFGNPCDAPYNYMVFDMRKGACDETGANVGNNPGGGVDGKDPVGVLVASNCVLSQIAMSASVQNFVITETGQVTGSQLAYEET